MMLGTMDFSLSHSIPSCFIIKCSVSVCVCVRAHPLCLSSIGLLNVSVSSLSAHPLHHASNIHVWFAWPCPAVKAARCCEWSILTSLLPSLYRRATLQLPIAIYVRRSHRGLEADLQAGMVLMTAGQGSDSHELSVEYKGIFNDSSHVDAMV